MSSNNPYDAVPEIDFAPESTEQILSDMVDAYEQSIFEQTGRREKLPVSSREKIILNTMAYLISLLYQEFGNRAKMNLPKYSTGIWRTLFFQRLFNIPLEGISIMVIAILFTIYFFCS